MKVKTSFRLINATTLIIIALLGFAAFSFISTQNDISENSTKRYYSYVVAIEMRESSQDLTSYIRSYVVTADPVYEAKYLEVLDIRNGIKPRPDGRTIALKSIMKELGFTQEEFDLIAEAEKRSNDLVWIETVAFNAVKGLYADNNNEFTIKGEPNLEMARNLVFGDDYNLEVSKIMEPIHKFFKVLDDRTTLTFQASMDKSMFTIKLIGVLLAILFIFTIIGFVTINKNILASLGAEPKELLKLANNISDGIFSGKDDNSTKNGVHRAILLIENTIKNLLKDMNFMSKQHDLGEIDVVIDSSKYRNAYRDTTEGINNMVQGHISINNKVMAVVEQFGQGNFDVPLEKFPGKKKIVNDTIEEVRSNLKNVISEIDKILQVLANGEVNIRANASTSKGNFNKIISGINNILDLFVSALSETMQVLSEVANGNLSSRMQRDYKGDFAILKQNFNHTLDSLPLQETVYVMRAIADGDLTAKMNGNYHGDNLQLKIMVNDTIDRLNEILANVRKLVENVAHGAGELQDASISLSQTTAEQTASLEEITATMSEIDTQAEVNANNANKANSFSREAIDVALNGDKAIMQLNKAMSKINETSKNIYNVIKVIEEIATQTNLLVLNDATEAPHAGQHGKVTEEVGNLTERTTSAVKEASVMIEEVLKTIKRGVGLVAAITKGLEDIQNASSNVAEMIETIVMFSNQQSQSVSQINQELLRIGKVTQSNTVNSERTTNIATELTEQSNFLREVISKFRLN